MIVVTNADWSFGDQQLKHMIYSISAVLVPIHLMHKLFAKLLYSSMCAVI